MITVGFGTFAALLMQFAAGAAVGMFSDDAEVIAFGTQYMKGYVWDCIFAGIHFCFSGYFCAYGLSNYLILHNFLSIVCARIPLAWLASKYFPETLFPMGCAAPIGSLLSVVICIAAYLWMNRHPEKVKLAA